MKKVSLVVSERDWEASLEKIREAGVLHPERKAVSSAALSVLLDRRFALRKAMGLLRRYSVEGKRPDPGLVQDFGSEDLVGYILDLADEKKTFQEQLAREDRECRRIESWGDFDPAVFTLFAEQGLKLIPYEIPLRLYGSLGDEVKLLVLSRDKRKVRALALETEIPGLHPFSLPSQSLTEMKSRLVELRKRLEGIEGDFSRLALLRGRLDAEFKDLQERIEFETARAGMETLKEVPMENSISWISGYVPQESLGLLKRASAENGWALVWEDPSPGDRPPTLVKNGPVVRIIQPLFSFLGTIPGYREYDISKSYLVFFCLFFAMIFGDAAYGMILFIISLTAGLVLKMKGRPEGGGKIPDAARLFMLLSCCTVVWGSITGSWFAVPVDKLPPLFRAMIIPPFNGSGSLEAFPPLLRGIFNLPEEIPVGELKTRWNIQFLCFTVGAGQLVWARSKNIKKLFPSLTALAQAGWLLMMIGLYFLVLFLLLRSPMPPFAFWFIGIGLGFYFVFAEQQGGNFLKNIVKSFSNFLSIFLNVVGSFADIISYIRLFAVGLAGSIIAQSFNSMALPEGGFGGAAFTLGLVLRFFAALLILAFGHSLNLVMNALSVVVHGVRLNLLEYAGNHLGMEWSGYAYNPFARRQGK